MVLVTLLATKSWHSVNSCKFGHHVAALALITNAVTKLPHLFILYLSLYLSLSSMINIKGKVGLQMLLWPAKEYYPASCKTEKKNLPLIRIMNAGSVNFENCVHQICPIFQICPTFWMIMSWKKADGNKFGHSYLSPHCPIIPIFSCPGPWQLTPTKK